MQPKNLGLLDCRRGGFRSREVRVRGEGTAEGRLAVSSEGFMGGGLWSVAWAEGVVGRSTSRPDRKAARPTCKTARLRPKPTALPATGRKPCGSLWLPGCSQTSSWKSVVAPQRATKKGHDRKKPQKQKRKSRRKYFTHNGLISREFRTPLELFLAGVAAFEPHIIRLLLAA